jgi:LPXTG-motif cell wall-anchored protein
MAQTALSRAPLPDGPWEVVIETLATFYTDVGLTPGTAYSYRVRAFPVGEPSNNATATASVSSLLLAGMALAGAGGLGYFIWKRSQSA